MTNGTNGEATHAAPLPAIDLLERLARYRAAIVELLAIIRRDGGYMPTDAQLVLREVSRLVEGDDTRAAQAQLDGDAK